MFFNNLLIHTVNKSHLFLNCIAVYKMKFPWRTIHGTFPLHKTFFIVLHTKSVALVLFNSLQRTSSLEPFVYELDYSGHNSVEIVFLLVFHVALSVYLITFNSNCELTFTTWVEYVLCHFGFVQYLAL